MNDLQELVAEALDQPTPRRDQLGFKLTDERLKLVKWEGEPPAGNPDPIGHPQCLEVLEIICDTGERRILYRRSEHASDE